MLVRQALAEAGRPAPVCVNAGVGGDTAAGMLKRLDRDVFPRRPTLVTLSAGINDVLHKVPDADYERDVTAVARRMKAAKVPLVILTTSVLGEKHAEADKHLADYNAILRQVAEKFDCRVADVNHGMHDARAAGQRTPRRGPGPPQLRGPPPDGPGGARRPGRQRRARAREAKGRTNAGGGARLEGEAAGGRRQAPGRRRRGGGEARQVVEGLPAAGVAAGRHWWLEQERQCGFAVSLPGVLGKAKGYLAFATHRFGRRAAASSSTPAPTCGRSGSTASASTPAASSTPAGTPATSACPRS